MLFLPSLKDNITRLEVDEEGVRKGEKGEKGARKERERREEGWVGEEFASVAETRLLVCVGLGNLFCFLRPLSFLSLCLHFQGGISSTKNSNTHCEGCVKC